jgi:P4 family phage/plasmid primase-like protien
MPVIKKDCEIKYNSNNAIIKHKFEQKDIDLEEISFTDLEEQLSLSKYKNLPLYETYGKSIDLKSKQYVKIFFDIDKKSKKYPDLSIDEFKIIHNNAVNFICKTFNCNESDLVYSTAHRTNKFGEIVDLQFSEHIVIKNMKATIDDLIIFKNMYKDILDEKYSIDPAPYSKAHSLRIVNTSKEGQNRPLKIQNGDISDHFITKVDNVEKIWTPPNDIEIKQFKKIKNKINKFNDTQTIEPITNKKNYRNNIEDAKYLLNLLDKSEYNNYIDWIDIGLIIKNSFDNELGFNLFNEWSSEIDNYQGESDIKYHWNNMKPNGNKTIASLHFYAKKSNILEYNKRFNYVDEKLDKLIKQSNGCTDPCAKVIHYLYRDRFKAIPIATRQCEWYEFKNHRWEEIVDATSIRRLITEEVVSYYESTIFKLNDEIKLIEDIKEQEKSIALLDIICKTKNKLLDVSFKDNVIRACQVEFEDSNFKLKLDKNTYLLSFKNGIYDLSKDQTTGKIIGFRNGRPDDYISKMINYDYKEFDENSKEVEFVFEFFYSIFNDDDRVNFILNLLASTLNGKSGLQYFFILSGCGANGKSKFKELIELIFEEYYTDMPVSLLTNARSKAGAATPELLKLKDRRIVFSEEPENMNGIVKFNTAIVKEFTAQPKITARDLFARSKEMISFDALFILFLCCNEKPSFSSNDEAIWRRIQNIVFENKFVDNPDPNNEFEKKRDYNLSSKLNDMKQAFMYVIIKYYCEDYSINGIIIPDKIINDTQIYRNDNDFIKEYINENLIKSKGSSIRMEEIFNNYILWARADISKKITRKTLKENLIKRLNVDYNEIKGFIGYKLNENNIYNECLLDNEDDNEDKEEKIIIDYINKNYIIDQNEKIRSCLLLGELSEEFEELNSTILGRILNKMKIEKFRGNQGFYYKLKNIQNK